MPLGSGSLKGLKQLETGKRWDMEFREWILERLTPAVMVISSPEAEEMCQEKNGLTVVDMLRPYGFLHQLSGELLMNTCLR